MKIVAAIVQGTVVSYPSGLYPCDDYSDFWPTEEAGNTFGKNPYIPPGVPKKVSAVHAHCDVVFDDVDVQEMKAWATPKTTLYATLFVHQPPGTCGRPGAPFPAESTQALKMMFTRQLRADSLFSPRIPARSKGRVSKSDPYRYPTPGALVRYHFTTNGPREYLVLLNDPNNSGGVRLDDQCVHHGADCWPSTPLYVKFSLVHESFSPGGVVLPKKEVIDSAETERFYFEKSQMGQV